jgi:hypothetical protein
LLLEDIKPGTKVSDEPQVPPVNEVAELLTGLRETAKYDAVQLPMMAQGMESMFSRIGGLLSNPQVSPLVARQVLDDRYHRARELASDGPEGLLHGDLHLSNILRAGAPVAFIGAPAAFIGEAKHRDRRPGLAELRKLQHLRDLLTATDAAFGLFSAAGFTAEMAAEAAASRSKILLATLNELYGQPPRSAGRGVRGV